MLRKTYLCLITVFLLFSLTACDISFLETLLKRATETINIPAFQESNEKETTQSLSLCDLNLVGTWGIKGVAGNTVKITEHSQNGLQLSWYNSDTKNGHTRKAIAPAVHRISWKNMMHTGSSQLRGMYGSHSAIVDCIWLFGNLQAHQPVGRPAIFP